MKMDLICFHLLIVLNRDILETHSKYSMHILHTDISYIGRQVLYHKCQLGNPIVEGAYANKTDLTSGVWGGGGGFEQCQ